MHALRDGRRARRCIAARQGIPTPQARMTDRERRSLVKPQQTPCASDKYLSTPVAFGRLVYLRSLVLPELSCEIEEAKRKRLASPLQCVAFGPFIDMHRPTHHLIRDSCRKNHPASALMPSENLNPPFSTLPQHPTPPTSNRPSPAFLPPPPLQQLRPFSVPS